MESITRVRKWVHCSVHNLDYPSVESCPKCDEEWKPDVNQIATIEESLRTQNGEKTKMGNFIENVLRKIEEVQKIVELRQKLIEHYKQEKQKQNYIVERNQKEKEFLR